MHPLDVRLYFCTLMEKDILQQMRANYAMDSLNRDDVNANPFTQFELWFEQAIKAEVNEPNAFILATSTSEGKPSARVVLMKGFDHQGLVFYTNYASRKGKELSDNAYVAVVFNWLDLQRQVRLEGKVQKISEAESIQYFNSRPFESQVSAAVSPQSQEIENKKDLQEKAKQLMIGGRHDVAKPKDWGGYIIQINYFEFWQGRPNRLHDRVAYKKDGDEWKVVILAP